MLSDESPIQGEKTDHEQEIWSAIRYLDPGEQDHDRAGKIATVVTVLTLLLIAIVWILLCFRGL